MKRRSKTTIAIEALKNGNAVLAFGILRKFGRVFAHNEINDLQTAFEMLDEAGQKDSQHEAITKAKNIINNKYNSIL